MQFRIDCCERCSTDNTHQVLKQLTLKIKELCVISLRKNYGQTAAMSAGFDNSKGDIVITLDGDLQNDPNDIPILISEINNGYDLICGCLLYTSPSPRDNTTSRMPSSA